LEAIERLDVSPSELELALVDNGSTDGESYERLRSFGASTRFCCKVLQTFTPGNSAGRNLALRHATCELLIFIDDDCYVDRGFVHDWQEVFARGRLGYASGMVIPHDPNYSSYGCNEQATEEPVPPGNFLRRGLIAGSNMAFTRSCLNAVGGFDERFGAGTPFAGEEWDVALRASAKGWAGGYFPQPRVAHDHRRTEVEGRERLLYYDYGAGAVYAKNSFRLRGRIFSSYARELRWLEHDRTRRGMLLKGYRDFAARSLRPGPA
jgi:GT2 family glycosyltransferase